MGYKQTPTTCTVQLVSYRALSSETAALCEALRREAGRSWTDMLQAHIASRDGEWLTERDLRTLTRGGRYRLHSQSVQALGQKLIANVDTARTLSKGQPPLEATQTPESQSVGQTVPSTAQPSAPGQPEAG
jgi:hypothetical protein